MTQLALQKLYSQIRELLLVARNKVLVSINTTMVQAYFQIGKLIVEDEQKGEKRAGYAEATLKIVSTQLTKEFGKGFSETNLRNMRYFYLVYSKDRSIQQTVSAEFKLPKLSWSHLLFLMRLDEDERKFYQIESESQNWSLRELKRQFNSMLYPRLALSRDKEGIKQLARKGQVLEKPSDIIKDPYILEFLGLDGNTKYSEAELETAVIEKLQKFLLELGKGFTFVARQYRLTFDDLHFRVDLVFYNRILQCFVLFDLKTGKLTHQDLGQMQMYVNYFDRKVRNSSENKSIGIILCYEKNDAVVEYTLPKDNKQIFASKYKLYLPSKKELQKQVEEAIMEVSHA